MTVYKSRHSADTEDVSNGVDEMSDKTDEMKFGK